MQKFNTPLVSVALCTYNGEKFLRKQLDSLLAQGYKNIEIIIVDDQSHDNTWSIIQEYAEKDKRIFAYQNKLNIGYIRNFEKAILLCRGDYIALADQDDIWENQKIQVLVDSIGDNILVYHNSDFIDADDKRIGDLTMASKYRMYEGNSCLPFIVSNCVSGHAAMFKKELTEYLFPFNNENCHDWWIAYVAFNVGNVKFVDQVLVHYRQHPETVTDSLRLQPQKKQKKKSKNIDRIAVNLKWVNYLSNFRYNKESGVIKKAYESFANLRQGKHRARVALFLIRHYDDLFYIFGKRRGFFSKVNFVRKICYR